MFMPQRISIARATNAPSNLDAFRHPVMARRVARAGDSIGRLGPKMKTAPSGCSELSERS
jgi:hypothetical protein